jgi:hypothetical protein
MWAYGCAQGGRNGCRYLSREYPVAGSGLRVRHLRDAVSVRLGMALTKPAHVSVRR